MASETGTPGEARHPAVASAALIGKSVIVKGELEGSEDLTIEGQVEGKIRAARPHPDDWTRAAASRRRCSRSRSWCFGELVGNINASETVDIRESGSVDGDIVSPRVAIADGAHFRGSIDMQRKGAAPAKGAAAAPDAPSPLEDPAEPRRVTRREHLVSDGENDRSLAGLWNRARRHPSRGAAQPVRATWEAAGDGAVASVEDVADVSRGHGGRRASRSSSISAPSSDRTSRFWGPASAASSIRSILYRRR